MRLGVLAMGVVLGACAGASEATGAASDEVVRGTAADARGASVVRLEIAHPENGTEELCSGTVVGPNLVLTARHCLARRDPSRPRPICQAGALSDTPDDAYVGDVPPEGIHVILGDAIAADTGSGVVGATAAPTFDGAAVAARGARIVDDGAETMCGHDLAVVVLDRAVEAPPATVRMGGPVVGETLTAVGWGRTQDGYPRTKQMRVGIPVLAVGAGELSYTRPSGVALRAVLAAGELGVGESVCNGDSGGPLLDDAGAIVGVVSRIAPNGSVRCVETPVVYSIAAGSRDLIDRAR